MIDQQPGLVLLDLRMPGTQRSQFHDLLRSSGFTIPVVFMSGAPEVAATASVRRAGYLRKPFDFAAMLDLVSQLLPLPAGDLSDAPYVC